MHLASPFRDQLDPADDQMPAVHMRESEHKAHSQLDGLMILLDKSIEIKTLLDRDRLQPQP
jgi:hypothetical protein